MRTSFLRATLIKESRAYGFTIAFWGSGAALIKAHQLPTMFEALSYGFGAVLGFAMLSIFAYGNALGKPEYEESELLVLSMIHYLAALVPVAFAFLLSNIASPQAHLLIGLSTSITYNLGMLAEEVVAERLERFEKSLLST